MTTPRDAVEFEAPTPRPIRRTGASGASGAPRPHNRPDFIIIGAQKCATTSIWHYLRTHPAVFMPDWKEPNFFIEGGPAWRTLDWYESLFSGQPDDVMRGEASPAYTLFPHVGRVAERMAAVVPDTRLIYVIREPVQRMVSSWIQARTDYLEKLPLNEALLHQSLYLAGSQYALQLEQFLRYYDRSQILVMRYEDFAAAPADAMTDLCRFISVDPSRLGSLDDRLNDSASKEFPRMNTIRARRLLARVFPGQAKKVMARFPHRVTHRPVEPAELAVSDAVRDRVIDYLTPDLTRLRGLLGPDVDLWGYV